MGEFEIEVLQGAARWNDAEWARELLENGADAARAIAGLRTFRKETRDRALATLIDAVAASAKKDIAECLGDALKWAAVWNDAEWARTLLGAGADAERAAASLRGTEYEAKGLAALFAAGAFDLDAGKLADCCREALKGIDGAQSDAEETAALKKALDAL